MQELHVALYECSGCNFAMYLNMWVYICVKNNTMVFYLNSIMLLQCNGNFATALIHTKFLYKHGISTGSVFNTFPYI
jgi:hypothetical protein